jgi:hypothetical protein
VTSGREPADVAGVADDRRGDDRADSVEVGQSRRGCDDRFGDTGLGTLQLRVERPHFVEELAGELESLMLRRSCRFDRREERFGLRNHDFFADPTRDEFPGQRVEPTTRPVTRPSRIEMRLRQQPQYGDVILASHRRERWRTECRDRDRAGVVRIVLVRSARPEHPDP